MKNGADMQHLASWSGSVCLSRFDAQSRLLLRALMSGASGAHRALTVLHRQQRANPDFSLRNLIEVLCQDEIACPEAQIGPLVVKPNVCLFSASFKQNLLFFIYLVHSVLPKTTIFQLLSCLSQESHPNPWITALCRQLERKLGTHPDEPLYTTACCQRLQEFSKHLVGSGVTGGWAKCFSSQTVSSESQSTFDVDELGAQRKRRGSFVHLDSDVEETGRQSKRMKLEVGEPVSAEEETLKATTLGGSERAAHAETPASDSLCDVLPEHIKVSVVQIQELLENQAEWDQNSTDVFKVLNDSNPSQVEVLCNMLRLPDLPEHTLTKLCNSILSLSPDLSYSTTSFLIKSLLLEKVLVLSEPASRCLVTAVTSLCSRYPRPMCHALIGSVLEEKNIGHPQAELLNRLIEGCLDSHYRLLVLQMTFRITWSEAVLSIIHSLLDSKPVLNEDVFTQFTQQLVSQAPNLTKSVKFAKMMLTVLSKYSSHVTAEHKQSLSSCLMLNETFLKKSLHAALKRIPHT